MFMTFFVSTPVTCHIIHNCFFFLSVYVYNRLLISPNFFYDVYLSLTYDDESVFEYNATNDNVVLVSHSDFRVCNTSAPLKMFNSGNDSFTIKAGGHYYFTSNISGHCQGGQKLDVRVLKSSHMPVSQPPSPAVSPNPNDSRVVAAPVGSNAPAPSPAESKAVTHDPKWLLMSTVGVAICGVVILVHGFA